MHEGFTFNSSSKGMQVKRHLFEGAAIISFRKQFICPKDECVLMQNMCMDIISKMKDLVKMLADAGKKLSLSRIKGLLY